MADLTTPRPTPAALAALARRRRTPQPAPVLNTAAAAAAGVPPRAMAAPDNPAAAHAPWDRAAFERGIRHCDLHANARLLALVLAGLADPENGRIPRSRMPTVTHLSTACGLLRQQITTSLHHLQAGGWIYRSTRQGLDYPGRRALTLTRPASAAD